MRIDNVFNICGDKIDRTNIPAEYHEFLPENIKKHRFSYPYTYDPFMVWFNKEAKQPAVTSIYTDRLLGWDFEKHDRLCQKYFGNKGQRWQERDPKKIEAFLSDWTEKKIILVANIQYVNISSGFPTWRLDYYLEIK